jgi:YVTN family beta-propeller protein
MTQIIRRTLTAALSIGFLGTIGYARSAPTTVPPAPPQFQSLVRRPIALRLIDNGRSLLVANRRSGTIGTIDTASLQPVAEFVAGHGLSDLAISPDGKFMLACDEPAGQLVILHRRGAALGVAERLPLSASPVSVQLSDDGSSCTVACRWARRLAMVTLVPRPRVSGWIDLPFAPLKQLRLDRNNLVVADAFAGGLAVIDLSSRTLRSSFNLPIHNIRGMALADDGRRLLLTHQTLRASATASFDDIHWGNLLTNNLRSLKVDRLLQAGADPLKQSDLVHLGEAGHGVGDPAGLAVTDDRLFVALAGVHQIAIGRKQGAEWQYVDVGQRPTDLVVSPDGNRVYVANAFSDSIAVIDTRPGKMIATISLGPQAAASKIDRGEALFYDARLSHDGWMSCHSCHSDGHTSGRLADTLADGSYGTPKRILSLLGVGDTGPWAWNGSIDRLETQVRRSMESTMQGPKAIDAQVEDLTAFLKTLTPAPPQPQFPEDRPAAARGQKVFETHGCSRCHTPPSYTSAKTYDVGLVDEKGLRQFNPPSLRGVSQGGPYFHDGRAASLEEVFTLHRHELVHALPPSELRDLLAFLNCL